MVKRLGQEKIKVNLRNGNSRYWLIYEKNISDFICKLIDFKVQFGDMYQIIKSVNRSGNLCLNTSLKEIFWAEKCSKVNSENVYQSIIENS